VVDGAFCCFWFLLVGGINIFIILRHEFFVFYLVCLVFGVICCAFVGCVVVWLLLVVKTFRELRKVEFNPFLMVSWKVLNHKGYDVLGNRKIFLDIYH
jgi:hypothetical protein